MHSLKLLMNRICEIGQGKGSAFFALSNYPLRNFSKLRKPAMTVKPKLRGVNFITNASTYCLRVSEEPPRTIQGLYYLSVRLPYKNLLAKERKKCTDLSTDGGISHEFQDIFC